MVTYRSLLARPTSPLLNDMSPCHVAGGFMWSSMTPSRWNFKVWASPIVVGRILLFGAPSPSRLACDGLPQHTFSTHCPATHLQQVGSREFLQTTTWHAQSSGLAKHEFDPGEHRVLTGIVRHVLAGNLQDSWHWLCIVVQQRPDRACNLRAAKGLGGGLGGAWVHPLCARILCNAPSPKSPPTTSPSLSVLHSPTD